MAFTLTTLSLIEVANLLLSGYLMVVIFRMGVHAQKGLFSKALRIIFVAVSMVFLAYLIQFFYPFSSAALEVIFAIATLIFLALLAFAIHEIKRDLLGHAHLSERTAKRRPTYVD